MQLKSYQEDVLERVGQYINVLKTQLAEAMEYQEFQQNKGKEPKPLEYCANAWSALNEMVQMPVFRDQQGQAVHAAWVMRRDGLRREIPHICLKIPTGGGKTLLGACTVERFNVDYFRQQTGFVLWIVPSEAIYSQTWKLLANRESIYRQILERASGGRVMLLEKHDAFTKQDTENYLCIMLLMLQSSSRASKETLRMFKDSGSFTSFFPEVDDFPGNEKLNTEIPNLDTNDIADAPVELGGISLKQSLGNALRLIRPLIVMDEGHKAYSETAISTLTGFNPRIILELTATPNMGKERASNILVDVKGADLKKSEMIKLPINVVNYAHADWKHTLTKAHEQLANLARAGERLRAQDNRYIRPIMLVRVERTGKEQREKDRIHAEDVREYLIDRLGVKPEEIKVKSSSVDELKEEGDLRSEKCQVRYIITKDALREGWDCPFAYVLAILDRTSAQMALTQMIGRVLRQPEAQATSIPSLNECYIFCFDQEVKNAVDAVRRGLESEGMGDLGGFVRGANGSNGVTEKRVSVQRNTAYKGLSIFLPRVLAVENNRKPRPLDYDRDILESLDWRKFSFSLRDTYVPGTEDKLEETLALIDVGQKDTGEFEMPTVQETTRATFIGEIDLGFLVRQLLEVVPNPWEATRIIEESLESVMKRGFSKQQIYINRLNIVDSIKTDIKKQVNEAGEQLFRERLKAGNIKFELTSAGDEDLNWELAHALDFNVADEDRVMQRKSAEPLERLLFEKVYEKEFTTLEKDVAWYLDGQDAIKWWHRLAVKQDYHIQGWQRNRIFPDFLVCREDVGKGRTRFLVLETKGIHLKGNPDSEYKKKLFDLLSDRSQQAIKAGEFHLDTGDAQIMFKMLMGDTWQTEIGGLLH